MNSCDKEIYPGTSRNPRSRSWTAPGFILSLLGLLWAGPSVAGTSPPVANAGPDQSVRTGQTVQLDGTASSSSDGQPLDFSWVLITPVGSQATLSDPASATPTFVPDVEGTYTGELTVSTEISGSSAPDVVLITATSNNAPVANAGADQSTTAGSLVQLDGSGSSDADDDPLEYRWTLLAPAGSTATLPDSTAPAPTFVADIAGTYIAELTVTDGIEASAPDTVVITATGSITPIADAGPDQSVAIGALVRLDGSGSSDPSNGQLTYFWALSTPAGSGAELSDPASVMPTFTADVEGAYTAELVVFTADGSESVPDTVTINATSGPTAVPSTQESEFTDEGGDGSVVVQFDGSGSSDTDGTIVLWEWIDISGSVTDPPTPNSVIVAGEVVDIELKVGEHSIALKVTDNDGLIDQSEPIAIMVEEGVIDVSARNLAELQISPNAQSTGNALNSICQGLGELSETETLPPDQQDLLERCIGLFDPATTLPQVGAALEAITGARITAMQTILKDSGTHNARAMKSRLTGVRMGTAKAGLDLAGLNLDIDGQIINAGMLASGVKALPERRRCHRRWC